MILITGVIYSRKRSQESDVYNNRVIYSSKRSQETTLRGSNIETKLRGGYYQKYLLIIDTSRGLLMGLDI